MNLKSLKTLHNLVAIIYLATFGWLLFNAIVNPPYPIYESTMLLLAVLAVATIGLFYKNASLIHTKLSHTLKRCSWLSSRVFLITVFSVIFILHLFIAYSLSIYPSESGWDSGIVYRSAVDLAEVGAISEEAKGYYNVYPNNLSLLAVLSLIFSTADYFGISHYAFVAIFINVTAMNMAFWIMFILIRRTYGLKAALLSIPFGLVLITLSAWSRTFYSDTLGLIIPVSVLWLLQAIAYSRSLRKDFLLAVLGGFLIAIGVSIKPYTLAIVTAAALFGVAATFFVLNMPYASRNLRKLILSVVGSIVGLCIFLVLFSVFSNAVRPQLTPDIGMPVSRFVMMGLSKECSSIETERPVCRYGAWNQRDVSMNMDVYLNREEFKHRTETEIFDRLENFGVGGYLKFITEKGAWVVSDGSFFAYGEGKEGTAQIIHPNSIVTSIMHPMGEYYRISQNFFQYTWLVVLFLGLVSSFATLRQPRLNKSWITIVRLSLLILMLMVLLLEGRSRYLYMYVPFFIYLAIHGLTSLELSIKDSKLK